MPEKEDYDKSATPTAHKTSHQDEGGDEISVASLSGELADDQKSAWAKVSGKPTTFAPEAHKTSHQDGGADELSVTGLAGLLADAQTPLAHKTSHQDAGSDEISVAGLSGLLADDQHVIDAEVTALIGATQPAAHKTSHQDTGTDEISVAGLTGLLADPQTPLSLPKFSAHKNNLNQLIDKNIWTKVTYKTKVYDTHSTYYTADSKWIPGKVGYVHVSASIIFLGMTDSSRIQIAIYLNGNMRVSTTFICYTSAGYQGVQISADINILAITDYVEIYAQHGDTVDQSILGAIGYSWVMGHMLV